ncbi:hypothetical protein, partial [Enterobacter hormaechei]|uniref:hypothetical protein n=2 Tax=Enterobacteriaceae TaxID=543 RepID=UPI00312C9500
RDAFRSGDVWLAHSRRYGDLKQVLVPMIAAQENAKLAVPSNPGVLGIFRPKTTKCSGGPAVCGLQRGITFFEIPIWALFE